MSRVRRTPRELIEASRELRQRQTPAESRLWDMLRQRETLGHRVRRQHALRPYVLDFWIPAVKIAIEVDGSIHDEPEIAAQDRDRPAWLEAQGIKVLRFQNLEIINDLDRIVTEIRLHIQSRTPRA